jgi:hypothetical protein
MVTASFWYKYGDFLHVPYRKRLAHKCDYKRIPLFDQIQSFCLDISQIYNRRFETLEQKDKITRLTIDPSPSPGGVSGVPGGAEPHELRLQLGLVALEFGEHEGRVRQPRGVQQVAAGHPAARGARLLERGALGHVELVAGAREHGALGALLHHAARHAPLVREFCANSKNIHGTKKYVLD